MNIKESIKKIQDLSLGQRKIILWTIVIILGIILIVFWWNSAKETLGKINPGESIKQIIPQIEQQGSLNGEDLKMPDLEKK